MIPKYRNVLRNADGLLASCFCREVKRPYYFMSLLASKLIDIVFSACLQLFAS